MRTDAYRDALLANPSLLSRATVLDVGCGTGILRYLHLPYDDYILNPYAYVG